MKYLKTYDAYQTDKNDYEVGDVVFLSNQYKDDLYIIVEIDDSLGSHDTMYRYYYTLISMNSNKKLNMIPNYRFRKATEQELKRYHLKQKADKYNLTR